MSTSTLTIAPKVQPKSSTKTRKSPSTPAPTPEPVAEPTPTAQETLLEFQSELNRVGEELRGKVSGFNELRTKMAEFAKQSGLELPGIQDIGELEEERDEIGLGANSKYWGVSRAIERILLGRNQVITRFTLDELRAKLPEEFQDIPDDTAHRSLVYLRDKIRQANNHRPQNISLLAKPRHYGLSSDNGDYLFFNYDHLSITQGIL